MGLSDRVHGDKLATAGGKIANLSRENDRLQKLVDELERIVNRAFSSRDLHCGTYVAKNYQFSVGELKRLKAMITRQEQG